MQVARPLCIEILGALHHVTSRGDRREAIYLADADSAYWLKLDHVRAENGLPSIWESLQDQVILGDAKFAAIVGGQVNLSSAAHPEIPRPPAPRSRRTAGSFHRSA